MAGADRAYLDELWGRLRMFSRRCAAIPAEQQGSFEWLSAAGAFWKTARERAGLSARDVALELGLPVNQVRFLELGLVSRHELGEQRLRDYARTVGDPDLYDQFRERFES